MVSQINIKGLIYFNPTFRPNCQVDGRGIHKFWGDHERYALLFVLSADG
jgi:hypothetical protein